MLGYDSEHSSKLESSNSVERVSLAWDRYRPFGLHR